MDLAKIALTVHDALSEDYIANACIKGTRVLIDVLTELGVEAHPLKVRVEAYNPAGLAALEGRPAMSRPYHADTNPPPGWVPNVTSRVPAGKAYGGHLVAIVGDTLVDTTAGQFSRPQHWLTVPPVMVAHITSAMGSLKRITREGGLIEWTPNPSGPDYDHAPDWKPQPDLVAQVLESLRPRVDG